jgi:uncharacterized coiled-coil protein SlyX
LEPFLPNWSKESITVRELHPIPPLTAAGMKIDPDWLEEERDKEMAKCPVCYMLLDQPTTGCPEGHALCRQCFVMELSLRHKCPLCQHPTDQSRLQRCRPLEGLIAQMRMRCKHGKEADEGVGEGGAAPRAKRAMLGPPQSTSTDDLREELGRQGLDTGGNQGELAVRLEEHRRGAAGGKQGCSWRGKVCEFAAHLAVCGREEVECPCPGCEERVARAEVEEHIAASGAVHLQRAWKRAAEQEEKVAELQTKVVGQGETIARQNGDIARQNSVNAGLQKRVQALTRVFTWSTDSAWSEQESLPYTFTDGVRGYCYNSESAAANFKHWMGFVLLEGPACTMHFKCSILDKNDKVLRVVCRPEDADFLKPPAKTAGLGLGMGSHFSLTDSEKAGAVREDGSIKLRMVVHLYLPE